MSHINGTGHGSDHDWINDMTDRFGGEMGTRYLCRHGDAAFVHLYNAQPDIFEAMRGNGVSVTCVGSTVPTSTEATS